jgi:integrase
MNYKVNNFNIILTRVFEELEEKEIKATKIINMKPSYYEEFNKKRHFYKLESFNYFNNILTSDLLEVIAFVNCLNAFTSNKFDIDKSYEFESFECKLVSQHKKINIAVKFFNENEIFYYDKLEATVSCSNKQNHRKTRGLKMARLGSIKYQVSQILQKIDGIGTSKKETREQSGVKSLESGHKVSDKVHSFKSLENLRNDLTNLANFAKEEFQIKDIREINIDIVSSWIDSKNITYNTASNYASELNKVSDHFNFTKEEIKELRADFKKELPKAELETRAYKNLEKIELKEKHQVAFELQRDYGLRVNASTHINLDKQLNGNTLTFREKGGKLSHKELSPNLAQKLRENALEGKYEINKRTYARDFQKQIEKSGQKYNGTHGIRHSYAQKMLETHSKAEVSQEMGHSREEITDTYLR